MGSAARKPVKNLGHHSNTHIHSLYPFIIFFLFCKGVAHDRAAPLFYFNKEKRKSVISFHISFHTFCRTAHKPCKINYNFQGLKAP